MIVKYLNDGVWGFIDNVRQVASKDIDVRQLVLDYNTAWNIKNEEAIKNGWPVELDPCCYFDGEKVSEEVETLNKAYTKAFDSHEDLRDMGDTVHCENLIDGKNFDLPAAIVLLYLEDTKQFDSLVLITNQKLFLMNDKGQTIERIV